MIWEQKLSALKSLCPDASLYMRRPGDWYLQLKGVEIKKGGILASVGETGKTPEEAVEKTWERLTGLSADEVVVLNAFSGTRRHLRWNGFMWKDERVCV